VPTELKHTLEASRLARGVCFVRREMPDCREVRKVVIAQ